MKHPLSFAVLALALTLSAGLASSEEEEQQAIIVSGIDGEQKQVSASELSKALGAAGIATMGDLAGTDTGRLASVLQGVAAYQIGGRSLSRLSATSLSKSEASALASSLKSQASKQKADLRLAPASMELLQR